MKKILVSLAIIFSLTFTIVGISGCTSCNPSNEENGGQTEVETITTLEGIWESEHGRSGEHEKIVVEGTSIKCYRNQGVGFTDELVWAGVYIPFSKPTSEDEWIFDEDPLGYPVEQGTPLNPTPKTFNYKDGKLSCYMMDGLGTSRTIHFTKVSD